jgi:hypothetical protein
MRNRIASTIVASATVMIASVFPGPTFAQIALSQKVCEDTSSSADAFQRISACSVLIQTQHFPNGEPIPPKTLAWQHVMRATAYEAILDFKRAIADCEQALPFFPNGQTNIDRVKIQAQWAPYLKEIQDDNDYPNWSRAPFDRYWSTK